MFRFIVKIIVDIFVRFKEWKVYICVQWMLEIKCTFLILHLKYVYTIIYKILLKSSLLQIE